MKCPGTPQIPAPPDGADEFWLLNHLEIHGLHVPTVHPNDVHSKLECALEAYDLRNWAELLVDEMRTQYRATGQSPCGSMLWARRDDAPDVQYGALAWPTWLALAATDPLDFVTVEAMGREYDLAVAIIWHQHEPGSLAAVALVANRWGDAGAWLIPQRGDWDPLNATEELFVYLRTTQMQTPEERLTRSALDVPDFRNAPVAIAPGTREELDVFDLLESINQAHGSAVVSAAWLARQLADHIQQEVLGE